jgi:hypothetical protein
MVSPWGLGALWREMAFGPGTYPVFRQEVAYWDARLRGRWRLGEYFGFATLVNLVLLPATLLFFPGLLAVYALLDEALVIGASLPAATLVVRERQAGTWSLLRSTPMTTLDLAAAKLGGLLYTAWEGAAYLTGARWLGTLFALPLLLLVAFLPGTAPSITSLVVLALAYALFAIRPRLNLLFGGALGLMASVFSRSTTGATILSILLTGPLSLAYAWLILVYARMPNTSEWLGEGVLAGVLAQALAWLAPMAAVTLGRAVVTPALFALAVHGMGRLQE